MGFWVSEGSIWLRSRCLGLGMGSWVGEDSIWLRVKAYGAWVSEGSIWLGAHGALDVVLDR
jgi:hypothetical protein